MSAGAICSRITASASPSESVWTAAHRMAEFDVGTLVVLKEDHGSRAIGIVTDRDIAIRCVAEKLDPQETQVAQIMTTPVEAIAEETPIEEALSKMASAGTRRLVVTADGHRVAGILSLDDIVGHFVGQSAAIGRLLEKQEPRIPV
jgi:CBS domain-containing protein